MALFGKYRGDPLAPDLLHRSKNAQLVVDKHIMIGGIEALYVFELAFLVKVDEHMIIDRAPQAGALHLARLEHSIAIRENDRRPPLLHMFHRVEGSGI